MAIKNCVVCGGPFKAMGCAINKKSCSVKCSIQHERDRRRKRYAANPEKHLERCRVRRSNHPDKCNEISRRSYKRHFAKNSKKRCEMTLRWRVENPEKYRENYQRQNSRRANKIAAAMLFIKQLQTMDSKVFL